MAGGFDGWLAGWLALILGINMASCVYRPLIYSSQNCWLQESSHRLPDTARDCHRLSETATDCHHCTTLYSGSTFRLNELKTLLG